MQDIEPNRSSGFVPTLYAKQPEIVIDLAEGGHTRDLEPMIARMLASVPQRYLVGLSAVVLTTTDRLTRKRRRSVTKSRKRKVRIRDAGGLYHSKWNGESAWIEIFADRTLPKERSRWPFLRTLPREFALASVLFHEIGHYIHETIRPEFREREDVADAWCARLRSAYLRSRYSWMRPIARLFGILERLWKRMRSRIDAWNKSNRTT